MRLEGRGSSFGLATILRVVCLSLTAAAVLTAFFWVYQRDAISAIDKRLYESYQGRYTAQLDYVEELFRAQRYTAAAIQAENALREMQHIRTRDKNYEVKRALLLTLIRSSLRLGTTGATAVHPYAESWVESDERDVTALIAYIKVLRQIPGKGISQTNQ